SERGDALYFGSTEEGTSSLERRDLERGTTTEILGGDRISVPVFAGEALERWLVFSFVAEGASTPQLRAWTPARGLSVLSEALDGADWAIAPDDRSVAFYEGGRLVTVELSSGARSVAEGAADTGFVPSWRGGEVVLFAHQDATFAVHDRIRGSTMGLGDGVDWTSCTSEPDGSTSCLARASPNGGGSQLLRWDRPDDRNEFVTDGIMESRTCKDGSRMALRSRAIRSTDEDLLLVFDPNLGEPVPLDDRVKDWVVAPRWVAWIRSDGEKDQLFYSAYPAETH
ncbi:MAG TPA: hypothetical protein VGD74_03340, partial [Vulgatibacter sp.]